MVYLFLIFTFLVLLVATLFLRVFADSIPRHIYSLLAVYSYNGRGGEEVCGECGLRVRCCLSCLALTLCLRS